jgi:hypothetical protein
MEQQRTNSGPFRKSTRKHSIYTLTRARALIAQYPKAEAMARVREFLDRDDDV